MIIWRMSLRTMPRMIWKNEEFQCDMTRLNAKSHRPHVTLDHVNSQQSPSEYDMQTQLKQQTSLYHAMQAEVAISSRASNRNETRGRHARLSDIDIIGC